MCPIFLALKSDLLYQIVRVYPWSALTSYLSSIFLGSTSSIVLISASLHHTFHFFLMPSSKVTILSLIITQESQSRMQMKAGTILYTSSFGLLFDPFWNTYFHELNNLVAITMLSMKVSMCWRFQGFLPDTYIKFSVALSLSQSVIFCLKLIFIALLLIFNLKICE